MKFASCFLGIIHAAGVASAFAAAPPSVPAASPNIVYILADDMGCGDVSAYNPASAWRTPHIDGLARDGMLFTDAHSSSAVCTPSRYSLLTGRYAWRGRLKQQVAFGFSPPIIEAERLTVPALLAKNGYATAMVGKWHLGLDWAHHQPGSTPDPLNVPENPDAPKPPPENNPAYARDVDYTKPFGNGPLSAGFQSFIGISASLDMAPYVWLRDDHVELPPNRLIAGSKLPAMWRAGPIAGNFAHVDVLPRLQREAVDYINHRDGRQPFFLYLALASPHTPIVPSRDFVGRSKTSAYGDFCVQVDEIVGAVLAALAGRGLERNTIVIFAADNGCSPAADFAELRKFNHDSQPGLRGAKADIYEGGHRIPFIARWPARVAAGTRSGALVCQVDLLATCAQLLGVNLPPNAAEDSESLLPALTDATGRAPIRATLVNHSVNGSFAIRRGDWKLCLTPDSGGWSDPKPGQAPAGSPPYQLFNLAKDPAETTNLYAEEPGIVRELAGLLKQQIVNGRSTPGPGQQNTGGNDWRQLDWMKEFD